MNHCLWCGEEAIEELSWTGILLKGIEPLCYECKSNLDKISSRLLCQHCGRDLMRLADAYQVDGSCLDCMRWEAQPEWRGILERNVSLFHYNDFLKVYMARFKYRGDYVLREPFRKELQRELKRHFSGSVIVPVPLSEERLLERGFNQALAIAELLHCPVYDVLGRRHGEKQSKKNRSKRLEQHQLFYLKKEDALLKGSSIVLVDDIYTTGTTLRHAAKVLKAAGAKHVYSLTVARS